MKNNIIERVRALQISMTESVGSCFSERELEHLRVLIRLTVEFDDYLQSANINPLEPGYTCESIFAGVESFISVTRGYKVLVGATSSRVQWGMDSTMSLKAQFLSWFHEFEIETNFENKCRVLLDLFKLQIVFAGVLYD